MNNKDLEAKVLELEELRKIDGETITSLAKANDHFVAQASDCQTYCKKSATPVTNQSTTNKVWGVDWKTEG